MLERRNEIDELHYCRMTEAILKQIKDEHDTFDYRQGPAGSGRANIYSLYYGEIGIQFAVIRNNRTRYRSVMSTNVLTLEEKKNARTEDDLRRNEKYRNDSSVWEYHEELRKRGVGSQNYFYSRVFDDPEELKGALLSRIRILDSLEDWQNLIMFTPTAGNREYITDIVYRFKEKCSIQELSNGVIFVGTKSREHIRLMENTSRGGVDISVSYNMYVGSDVFRLFPSNAGSRHGMDRAGFFCPYCYLEEVLEMMLNAQIDRRYNNDSVLREISLVFGVSNTPLPSLSNDDKEVRFDKVSHIISYCLGKEIRGWLKGTYPVNEKYEFWFPKFDEKYEGENGLVITHIEEDNSLIIEESKDLIRPNSKNRIVFGRTDSSEQYRFYGIYRVDQNNSKRFRVIYKRICDSIDFTNI